MEHNPSQPPAFDVSIESRVAYCTMFDLGYLSRGLALIHSLRIHGVDDDIWVLCLDDETEAFLQRISLKGVHTATRRDLEGATSGLLEAYSNRSLTEYFFTCTPALVRFVLGAAEHYTWVTYLDSDMYFFINPSSAYAEIGTGDVGIVPHRFPEGLKSLEQYGTFNVAWVMFRNNPAGIACAEWWRDQCLDWCCDHPDNGRYADQGYLDQFPARFPSTVILKDPGINVAPWNLGRHLVTEEDGHLKADGSNLMFFHFHGLRKRGEWIYPNLATYKTRLTPTVRDNVYLPYIITLNSIERGTFATNFGTPLPGPKPQAATRNQRNLRSAAYRARRRLVQARERRSGSAFRIDEITDEGIKSRNYG
jgi:hypothetical protein